MRSLIIFSLAFTCTVGAYAQTPVSEPLLPWLGNTTPLPKSVSEVKSKCYNPAEGSYDISKVMGPLGKNIGETILKINGPGASATYTMPDTTGIADVQKMTPEQQQAWAMQYAMQQQAAATANAKLPSGAETAFHEEYARLNMDVTVFLDSMTAPFTRLLAENDAKQKHFSEQRDEMIKLCPIINAGGGEGGPDPSCVKKAEANYQQWQASWATEWFGKVSVFITNKKNEIRTRFSKGESMLTANSYFLNPTNKMYTSDAAGFQIMELNCLTGLETIIEKTWKVGSDIDRCIKLSHERCSEKY